MMAAGQGTEVRMEGAAEASTPVSSLPFWLCELAVLAWIGWALWLDAGHRWAQLRSPYQFDYGEGNVLATLARIAHGLTPYPDPRAFPNAIDPYGPVGYYLLSLPVRLTGVSFLYPRLLVVASVVIICILLGLTIATLTRSRMAGVLFGAAYAVVPVVQTWGVLLRVDFIGLAFCIAGVCAFTRGIVAEDAEDTETRKRKNCSASSASSATRFWLLPSAALFVLALFCKHSLLAAPAACLLYLASRKRWREALTFTAGGVALGIVGLVAAEALTHGFFLQHVLLTHPDPFDWGKYALRISYLTAQNAPLVALSLLLLLGDLRRGRLSFPALWLLLATITAITAGKMGSGYNHFLEWLLVLCLCSGTAWTMLARLRSRRASVALILAATVWMSAYIARRDFAGDPFSGMEGCAQAYAYVRDHSSDRMLAENVGALLLGGKAVWVLDPFVYSQIVNGGAFPDREVEPRLRSRWFDLILTRSDYGGYRQGGLERFTPGMLQALLANYRVTHTFQCRDAYAVYEPVRIH